MQKLIRQWLPIVASLFISLSLSACGGSSSSSSDTAVTPTVYYGHNAAFCNNTTLMTWGYNSAGQLGNGTWNVSSNSPAKLNGFTGYTDVAIGGSHSLVFQRNGSVKSWGWNLSGQLGNNSTTANNVPVDVLKDATTKLTDVVAVAAGGNHSLALDSSGHVWSWGHNGFGQLGVNGYLNSSVALQVNDLIAGTPLSAITAIAAGGSHSLALDASGRVWSWGYNSYGQLGTGTTELSVNIPTQITIPAKIVAIAAGGSHSLALDETGQIWAWGYNFFGQLGNGTNGANTDSKVPVPVNMTGMTGITAIAAGLDHSLALNSTTGQIWAWGYNLYGQLGDSTLDAKNAPFLIQGFTTLVSGRTGPQSIRATGNYSVARKSDGSLWTWGYNSTGQLGIGSNTYSSIPVKVTGF